MMACAVVSLRVISFPAFPLRLEPCLSGMPTILLQHKRLANAQRLVQVGDKILRIFEAD